MYKENNQTYGLNFIAKLIVLYYSISPFLYLLRTLSGDSDLTAIILRTSEPLLMLLTLYACFFQNKFKLNAYSFTLILLGLYGLSIAIVQENKLMGALAGYVHFMTGIILFIYFYGSKEGLNIDKFMRILSYSTLTCYSIVIAVMYGLYFLLGIHIYLGLACQILIIALFYNFRARRFLLSFFSLFLIIISGKRGVFVALLAGSTIAFLASMGRLHFTRSIKIFVVVAALISLVIVALPMASEKLLNKYTYNEKATVDDYSAGRWNEVISAYEWWSSNIENVVIGSGFGFTYTYIHSQRKMADTEDYKNVHFSYLNPLIIFGVPVTTAYFLCLFLIFIRIFRNPDHSLNYMRLSSLTYLIYACFVFDLFDEPIFWMINGLLFHSSNHVEGQSRVMGRTYT